MSRPVLFVMLNPSTADGNVDDPTIRRCIGFAKSWGYDSLTVANLYALQTSNPNDLKEYPFPIGRHNDTFLKSMSGNASITICAWGSTGKLRSRDVIPLLKRPLYALKLCKNGQPTHPLYQPASLVPTLWNPE